MKEGIEVIGTEEMVGMIKASQDAKIPEESEEETFDREQFSNSLAGHIANVYQQNKDARRDSGIEQEMLDSMDAFNGEYSSDELNSITEYGGSKIFMNLTATKCRACASWIKDIMMPANDKAWRFKQSKDPEINPFLMDEIESILKKEFANFEQVLAAEEAESIKPPSSEMAQQAQGSPPPGPSQGAQPPAEPVQPTVGKLAGRLREMNKARRDVEETFRREVELVARTEMKKFERIVEDQLDAGNWSGALSEFVEDFTIYPAAFMKGPIINIKPGLTYQDGKPVVAKKIVYMNKRISPLDMYPSANASTINDGSLIEHVRYERHEIAQCKGLDGYDTDKINEVLDNYKGAEFIHWLWTDIESDKAYAEKRGNEFQANKNIIHGLHFFGKAPVSLLREWGIDEAELENEDGEILYEDTDEIEVEAILVDTTVIKLIVNNDPLNRRPYYKASFQSRPGSFWGRSLPNLMRDIQRMCNATARALSNNMGLASGPQVEVYVDRLADKGDIEEITPFKIWQFTSDPTGGTGRAINFMQPSSNAAELLAVYKEFELRADDATGIPRYAYGNERTGGAAQTASGLSMLLESASKGIKDAIRHIDEGLIKPRLEYQFYWLLKEGDIEYSGDLEVIPLGSSALTMKAAEQAKRLELMQALSGNPAVLEVVGPEALALIFKTLFEDANMPEIIIPSGLEIRQSIKDKEKREQEAGRMQAQVMQEKTQAGLKATELQINGQKEMHQGTLKLKERELALKEKDAMMKSRDKSQELDSRERQTAQRALADASKAQADREFNDLAERRRMAFELTDLKEDDTMPTEVAAGRNQ